MNWRDVTDVIQLTLSDSEGPKDDYRTESLHNNRTITIQDYLHPNDPTQPTYEMWNHSGKNIPRYTLLFIIARASKLSNWGNRGEKSRRRAARERRSECIL